MSSPTFDMHGCTVWGYMVFTCSTCGKRAQGDFFKTDYATGGMPSQETVANSARPFSRYMPVGWASHYPDRYECPDHD